jgi:hypothetical protein
VGTLQACAERQGYCWCLRLRRREGVRARRDSSNARRIWAAFQGLSLAVFCR